MPSCSVPRRAAPKGTSPLEGVAKRSVAWGWTFFRVIRPAGHDNDGNGCSR